MLIVPLISRTSMLDGFEVRMATGSGTAKLRLLQSLVTLVDFDLSNTPFGAGVQDSIVLASCPIAATSSASGTVTQFQLINRNGDVALYGDVGGTDSYALRVPRAIVTTTTAQRLAGFVLRQGPDGRLFAEASLALQ